MFAASELISSARRYRGVSGRALARATGSSQAGLSDLERGSQDATSARVDRFLSALGYRLTVLPTRLDTVAAAAESVRDAVGRSDHDTALRAVWQLAADLRSAEPSLRVALCVTPPAPTGDARFDALIAGVADFLLSQEGLPRPPWLAEGWRSLEEPWDVEPVVALRPRARSVTPPALAAHGVFLDPTELVNV